MLHVLSLVLAQAFLALPVDGITCDRAEGVVEHIHSHLALYDRGRPVEVPAGIGIVPSSQCLYWLHTHTSDGFIHIESPVARTFTLGEFLDIWDEAISWPRATVWIDGTRWRGRDIRTIVLRDHQTILIENGTPFVHPPPVDWAKV